METLRKAPKLSCEQIYNVWASEPYLVQLFDLRPPAEFASAHIPGALNVQIDQILTAFDLLGEKLAVIICPEASESELIKLLGEKQNYVLMSECQRWSELEKPMTGLSLGSIQEQFKGVDMKSDIIFHQLFEAESSTYTYIIADRKTKEAAIIDPVLETVDRDLKLIEELKLKLNYVLDTHIHADHVTGAGEIRKRTNAKTAVSAEAHVECVDIPLEDGQELLLGNKKIKVIATPGHTNTCLTFSIEGMIFTGDTLLIRGCGRTDFQQGSSEKLFESVHGKLFSLPDETIIYPGHDYRGHTSSTIALEKAYNPRLAEKNSLEDFKKIMSELKLANPKKIHESVPANLACGKVQNHRVLHPQIVDGIPEVSCEDILLNAHVVENKKLRLIDVRRPDEFNAELGHIKGAQLVTLGPELTKFLESGDRSEEIVFVCRSGGRSGTATAESMRQGYKFTSNMTGGMLRWNEKKQPVTKN